MKNKTVEERLELANQFKKEALDKILSHAESYKEGFSASKSITNKIILDTLNKYRSELSSEEKVKLTKVINQDKIELLKAQINILLELQNKFANRDIHKSQKINI